MCENNPDDCDFDKYKIKYQRNTFPKLEKIGEGRLSDVYGGINTRNGKKVAIKVLKDEDETDFVRPISHELMLLEALKGGPNIV